MTVHWTIQGRMHSGCVEIAPISRNRARRLLRKRGTVRTDRVPLYGHAQLKDGKRNPRRRGEREWTLEQRSAQELSLSKYADVMVCATARKEPS